MNEQELRAMVRESIERQVALPSPHRGGGATDGAHATSVAQASFLRLPLPSGGDGDGACLIEPAVRCNHCGYCQSYGH
jgi:hypothetical protein